LPEFCGGCASRDRPMTSASKGAYWLNPEIEHPLVLGAE